MFFPTLQCMSSRIFESMLSTNPIFDLAQQFVQCTPCNLFLTGKAGTGKTTFLHHCKTKVAKNMAVVAPTGVAAIHAGGTTIHSFFQLPFGPFIPNGQKFDNQPNASNADQLLGQLRLSSERREVIRKLELLIIDEISMVRCDVLDAIDLVLKHVRNRYQDPFGGVQVLFIGDLQQLPPVIKDEEWSILAQHYSGPFFFQSQVLQQHPPLYLELEKIYRQTDDAFVQLLNQVRNNEMDADAFQWLEKRYHPTFVPQKNDGYITLTTHNQKAEVINATELNNLHSTLAVFEAEITGEFSEKAYPAEVDLKLKPSAQVMFIKNDTERIRRFFNGKIGVIESMTDEQITVKCPGETEPILVSRETWKNVRYTIDKQTNRIETDEIGSFTQFPLRLAWAITIHKSQGLTFEKAIIDAGDAFAPGQVYVALSRCKTMEGMILKSRILPQSIKHDVRIQSFSALKPNLNEIQQLLESSKMTFTHQTILQLFDVEEIMKDLQHLSTLLRDHAQAFETGVHNALHAMLEKFQSIEKTSNAFCKQLQTYFESHHLIDEHHPVQPRIQAASQHFFDAWQMLSDQLVNNPLVTDHKAIAQQSSKLLTNLHHAIAYKLHLLQETKAGFNLENFLQVKTEFRIPTTKLQTYSGLKQVDATNDSPNNELLKLLRSTRDQFCAEHNLPVYMVAGSAALKEMANYRPLREKDIQRITGFGIKRTKQFGQAFIDVILEYCDQYGLDSNMQAMEKPERPSKEKPQKSAPSNKKIKPLLSPTYQETLNLIHAGKSLDEMVELRKLATSTIETHLAKIIGAGLIEPEAFVSVEKMNRIREAIEMHGTERLQALKEGLPESISFGEIRMVVAAATRGTNASEKTD